MTISITPAEASANILAHVAEGRIKQGVWHGQDAQGREIACLLGSIHRDINSPADCSAHLIPQRVAEIIPPLFDGLSVKSVVPVARRFGKLIANTYILTPAQWDLIEEAAGDMKIE